jgi:hypothetical protein
MRRLLRRRTSGRRKTDTISRRPCLEPFAQASDLFNQRMDSAVQQLCLWVYLPLVSDMQRRMLMWLRWDSAGDWQDRPCPRRCQHPLIA